MKNIIITAVLILMGSSLLAGEVQETKEFADLKCKLTLPSPDFKWLDNKQVPYARAFMGNDSGTMLLLLAFKDTEGKPVDEDFAKGFDIGLGKTGDASKINGSIITFEKLPCYQVNIRIKQNNSTGTIRAFCANGYLYQLQIIGNKSLFKERKKQEKIFSSFEFIGQPVAPKLKALSAEQKAYKFGYMMGRIVFYCIVIAVIVGIVSLIKKNINGNKKNS